MLTNYLTILFLLGLIKYNIAQVPDSETTNPNQTALNTPYCFSFTWLGPKFGPQSHYQNATCEDVLRGAKGIPCVLPLAVTNNSNIPDTNEVWELYKTKPGKIACPLTRGEVCAKYTYKWNEAVENITYMCTKVNIENEGPVTSDRCFSQLINGREIEVCVCQSSVGKPCNSAYRNPVINFFTIIFLSISTIIMSISLVFIENQR